VWAAGGFCGGRIEDVDPQPLRTLLAAGMVPVVSGFQGVREDGETLTLGRGGSDTSAVALAAALGAECHIVTDVAAVYDRDPNLHPDARPIGEIDPVVGPAAPIEEFGSGLPTGGPIGQPTSPVGPPGGVIDERNVDRSPRLIGRIEQPAFPAALRITGRSGKVVAQFVVDTLGRAEMADLRMVEATDPLFAESVRAVLPRYRFSPGEAGGRKVRTLVQLPFDFTLTR
jgi:hypothetical protein